jgi:hypothetical protein
VSEVIHITHVAYYEWEKLWQGNGRSLEGHAANSIFFERLVCNPKSRGMTHHSAVRAAITCLSPSIAI